MSSALKRDAAAGARSVSKSPVRAGLERARDALLQRQHDDGHWCFEFEADCTIPAEYVLMMHYMNEIDGDLQARLARYLRAHQDIGGGWPLYPGGVMDVSCTVKSYYALKLAGDRPDDEHMRRARDAILAAGGAEQANVFTRIMLAQFRQVPWHAVPFLPVEMILLPPQSPFHFMKVSYWSRTVMVPLLVLVSLRRQAQNPHDVDVQELFTQPPEQVRNWFKTDSVRERVLLELEQKARHGEAIIPWGIRRWALRRCEQWLLTRLNGEGGLGAIFPAMVNAYEALDALGYGPQHPLRRQAKRALQALLVDRDDTTYCQPCMSPVWDTALATMALQEAGEARPQVMQALDWLAARQLHDEPGDWQEYRPRLAGGGWPFQYRNDRYPDLDDTSVIALSMWQADAQRYAQAIERATHWLAGMQSRHGGFASFDADNTHYALNDIPFADHGALLDPPTEDVTSHCMALFAALGDEWHQPQQRALAWISHRQEPSGAWWGRWGCNYIYGTWAVLAAFEQVGIPDDDERVCRAATWLKSVQQPDGGFGETNDTYNFGDKRATPGTGQATPEQTAWAVLALMAAGEVDSTAVARGIDWLLAHQAEDGLWYTDRFNAPGFPRVFYLRYHGYSAYFPLWALARYHNLTA